MFMPEMRSLSFLAAGILVSTLVGCTADATSTPDPDAGIAFCDSPAPLSGQFDPGTPGYIFLFDESVPVDDEVARLSSEYPLEELAIFESPPGFYAVTSAETLARLRCEPSIAAVEFNAPTMNL
jgi:hypothetical protein